MAGDYFGTFCHPGPISDAAIGHDSEPSATQIARFQAAYDMLARKPDSKQQAQAVMKTAQAEIDRLNKALQKLSSDPDAASKAYASMDEVASSLAYTLDTNGRYALLAAVNFDHFGQDARTAYNAGHALALKIASGGTERDLELAYTVSAFADHYLEDSFSAGHMRTPRRFLHSAWNPAWDVCARYMHSEDSAIGLHVAATDGSEWIAYGDTRMLDKANDENKRRCIAAIQASVDEVFEAYHNPKMIPQAKQFRAWTFAPTLASAMSSKQQLSPLFTTDGQVRTDIADRRTWAHHAIKSTDLAVLIWHRCASSGLWDHPIRMTGEMATNA